MQTGFLPYKAMEGGGGAHEGGDDNGVGAEPGGLGRAEDSLSRKKAELISAFRTKAMAVWSSHEFGKAHQSPSAHVL